MAAVPRSSVTLSGVAEAGMGVRLPVNAVRVAERRAPPLVTSSWSAVAN